MSKELLKVVPQYEECVAVYIPDDWTVYNPEGEFFKAKDRYTLVDIQNLLEQDIDIDFDSDEDYESERYGRFWNTQGFLSRPQVDLILSSAQDAINTPKLQRTIRKANLLRAAKCEESLALSCEDINRIVRRRMLTRDPNPSFVDTHIVNGNLVVNINGVEASHNFVALLIGRYFGVHLENPRIKTLDDITLVLLDLKETKKPVVPDVSPEERLFNALFVENILDDPRFKPTKEDDEE